MTLNKEQLDTLGKLGATFFSVPQCAIVIEVDPMDLKKAIKNPNTEAHKVYYKGLWTSTLRLRESIMDLAIRGSSPAQAQMLKILEQALHANG